METVYGLIKKETYQIPTDKQVRELVYIGDYLKCLGKFQSLSGFSFKHNNSYSYTQFFIDEVRKVRLCNQCNSELGPDRLIGDDHYCICEECNALNDCRIAYVDENNVELISKL